MIASIPLALLLAAAPLDQPEAGPPAGFSPLPGSIKFCSQHIVGAFQGTHPGEHISWAGYYSVEPVEKVVRHYLQVLGAANHEKEDDEDVWRFPVDVPERVLAVTGPQGAFPRAQCDEPPATARAIVIISTMTRPD